MEFRQAYDPIARTEGVVFVPKLDWTSPLLNATGVRKGQEWRVTILGGLLRHPSLTEESFRIVLCHELGHILGGRPEWSIPGIDEFPSSNSGQPDYYTAAVCMKRLLGSQDNVAFLAAHPPKSSITETCRSRFAAAQPFALCARTLMAAEAAMGLIAEVMQLPSPDLNTPDPTTAPRLEMGHPNPQCRLDTFKAGALCDVDLTADARDEGNRITASCDRGLSRRPSCWSAPALTSKVLGRVPNEGSP